MHIRGQSLFIAILAVLGITAHPALIGIARVPPSWAKGFSYQAEVTDVSGVKYFPAVKDALVKAEKSINLVMFTIETPLEGKNSKVSQLIDALIEAKNRRVDVEVILDQNVDFVHRGHPSDWEVEIKSTRAYKRLKDAGIKVHYDEPARYRRHHPENKAICEEKVKKAFDIVALKNTDNPKKSYAYVVGIIENK